MYIKIKLTPAQMKQLKPIRDEIRKTADGAGVFAQIALENHLSRVRVGEMEVYLIKPEIAKKLRPLLSKIRQGKEIK